MKGCAMKGSETKLVAYMEGADKRFVIPVYQRNYDWKMENCKQLFDDLVKVVKLKRKSHFFGSIVSVINKDEFNEHLVIDGQQRLTTVSLLLLAMCNLIREGTVVPKRSNLAEKIYKTYLVDPWQEDKITRIKLKPVKNDNDAFQRLFEERDEHRRESNLTVNYDYFYNRLQKEEVGVDELYEAIERLEIINISLGDEDNPQLIFESLNSTGVALSEGDKIRNFILMGQPFAMQEKFYRNYWNKIEVLTKYDVSLFVRDYLSVKTQRIPAMNKVYFTFKSYVEEKEIETEKLLQDLLEYATSYGTLLSGGTRDVELNGCIRRLNHLETTVTRPFFMEVLRLHKECVLSLKDVREIFLIAECYLFRRMMCELATNALNKIFVSLHREIMRYDGTDKDYPAKFKYALLSKTDHGRFPNDRDFIEAFANRQVYLMNSKNKIYILERLENYGTLEAQDVYKQCESGVYSVEHIMPQTLTPAWRNALGEECDDIYEEWLHRIGNLTLTGYNSTYSNQPFVQKRDATNGFAESHLYLNQWIAKQETWGVAELQARTSILMGRALQVWPLPETDFKPAEKQYDTCSLDDEDVDVTGRDVAKFIYKNTEHPVVSWIDMMEQVMRILHTENKAVLSALVNKEMDVYGLSAYVSATETDLRSSLCIEDGIYIETNTSTMMKLALLRKFFKVYDQDADDLVFCLKDPDEVRDDLRPIHDFRRRYWEGFLAELDVNHLNNPFVKETPSIHNWLDAWCGRGIRFVCTVNINQARVEVYLGNSSMKFNKNAFDYLYVNKADIEAQLGISLSWDRLDTKKASSVSCNLPGVNIKNEADWTQMRKFHIEWSKKFYDTFMPYIEKIIHK